MILAQQHEVDQSIHMADELDKHDSDKNKKISNRLYCTRFIADSFERKYKTTHYLHLYSVD